MNLVMYQDLRKAFDLVDDDKPDEPPRPIVPNLECAFSINLIFSLRNYIIFC